MEMTKSKKIAVVLHFLSSVVLYAVCVALEKSGLGLMVFGATELVFMLVICRKKAVTALFCVPIFILCASPFLHGGRFAVFNYPVIIALIAGLIAFSKNGALLADPSLSFVADFFTSLFAPFKHFAEPIKWMQTQKAETRRGLSRVLLSIVISVPFIAVVVFLLSRADEMFMRGISGIVDSISHIFSFTTVLKIYMAFLVALFLTGAVYAIHEAPAPPSVRARSASSVDAVIPNTVMIMMLIVYAVFIAIQVKYLFLASGLPEGLTYAEYARRGFFELLLLSGFNLLVLLPSFRATRNADPRARKLSTALCLLLCIVTMFLLISSFYRMWLYHAAYGFTRLRFLVFGFLIFEFLGLILTLVYLLRPRFNIILTYCALALIYCLSVNVVGMDRIIAKNQVDLYFDRGIDNSRYIETLSIDAAPQVARLLGEDGEPGRRANNYFYYYGEVMKSDPSWQSLSLAQMDFERLYDVHFPDGAEYIEERSAQSDNP